MNRLTRHAVARPGAAVVVVAALAGCAPDSATAQGDSVRTLYDIFLIASAGVFLLVVGLLAWSIVRYRGQPGRMVEMPKPVHGNLRLELVWWALPAGLVLVLAFLTVGVLSEVDAFEADPAVTVEVTGFQWGWQFEIRDEDVVISGTSADPPRLVLPLDQTIAFEIESTDVVHSFSIPAFLIKRDAIPGRANRFDVLIEDEGTYSGQCGEFCGLYHARQLFEIDAVPRAEFDAWLAEQSSPPTGDPTPGPTPTAEASP